MSWNKDDFWEKLRFEYKLSFLNENTLEEVFSIRISRLQGFVALLLFVIFLITITATVIIKTPVRNYLPGYLPAEVRQEIIDNALRVDSLENALQIQAQYIANVRAALNGTLEVEQIRQTSDSTAVGNHGLDLARSKETEDFVRSYEEEEQFNINGYSTTAQIERPVFCRPAKGVISSQFNVQDKHYGIDIAAIADSPVMSTQRGVVVFAGFDPEIGYLIEIQHYGGYLSIYKHCSKLLKKQGQTVDTGEVVALVGNTGKYSTGSHLHFEIWKNGMAVNPEEVF